MSKALELHCQWEGVSEGWCSQVNRVLRGCRNVVKREALLINQQLGAQKLILKLRIKAASMRNNEFLCFALC